MRSIKLVEQRQKQASLVMQAGRVGKTLQSEVDNFQPECVIVAIHARVPNEQVELFVGGRQRRRSPQGFECQLLLPIADVALGKQVLHVRARMSSAAETTQNLN